MRQDADHPDVALPTPWTLVEGRVADDLAVCKGEQREAFIQSRLFVHFAKTGSCLCTDV
jgi:hypothetical protein